MRGCSIYAFSETHRTRQEHGCWTSTMFVWILIETTCVIRSVILLASRVGHIWFYTNINVLIHLNTLWKSIHDYMNTHVRRMHVYDSRDREYWISIFTLWILSLILFLYLLILCRAIPIFAQMAITLIRCWRLGFLVYARFYEWYFHI